MTNSTQQLLTSQLRKGTQQTGKTTSSCNKAQGSFETGKFHSETSEMKSCKKSSQEAQGSSRAGKLLSEALVQPKVPSKPSYEPEHVAAPTTTINNDVPVQYLEGIIYTQTSGDDTLYEIDRNSPFYDMITRIVAFTPSIRATYRPIQTIGILLIVVVILLAHPVMAQNSSGSNFSSSGSGSGFTPATTTVISSPQEFNYLDFLYMPALPSLKHGEVYPSACDFSSDAADCVKHRNHILCKGASKCARITYIEPQHSTSFYQYGNLHCFACNITNTSKLKFKHLSNHSYFLSISDGKHPCYTEKLNDFSQTHVCHQSKPLSDQVRKKEVHYVSGYNEAHLMAQLQLNKSGVPIEDLGLPYFRALAIKPSSNPEPALKPTLQQSNNTFLDDFLWFIIGIIVFSFVGKMIQICISGYPTHENGFAKLALFFCSIVFCLVCTVASPLTLAFITASVLHGDHNTLVLLSFTNDVFTNSRSPLAVQMLNYLHSRNTGKELESLKIMTINSFGFPKFNVPNDKPLWMALTNPNSRSKTLNKDATTPSMNVYQYNNELDRDLESTHPNLSPTRQTQKDIEEAEEMIQEMKKRQNNTLTEEQIRIAMPIYKHKVSTLTPCATCPYLYFEHPTTQTNLFDTVPKVGATFMFFFWFLSWNTISWTLSHAPRYFSQLAPTGVKALDYEPFSLHWSFGLILLLSLMFALKKLLELKSLTIISLVLILPSLGQVRAQDQISDPVEQFTVPASEQNGCLGIQGIAKLCYNIPLTKTLAPVFGQYETLDMNKITIIRAVSKGNGVSVSEFGVNLPNDLKWYMDMSTRQLFQTGSNPNNVVSADTICNLVKDFRGLELLTVISNGVCPSSGARFSLCAMIQPGQTVPWIRVYKLLQNPQKYSVPVDLTLFPPLDPEGNQPPPIQRSGSGLRTEATYSCRYIAQTWDFKTKCVNDDSILEPGALVSDGKIGMFQWPVGYFQNNSRYLGNSITNNGVTELNNLCVMETVSLQEQWLHSSASGFAFQESDTLVHHWVIYQPQFDSLDMSDINADIEVEIVERNVRGINDFILDPYYHWYYSQFSVATNPNPYNFPPTETGFPFDMTCDVNYKDSAPEIIPENPDSGITPTNPGYFNYAPVLIFSGKPNDDSKKTMFYASGPSCPPISGKNVTAEFYKGYNKVSNVNQNCFASSVRLNALQVNFETDTVSQQVTSASFFNTPLLSFNKFPSAYTRQRISIFIYPPPSQTTVEFVLTDVNGTRRADPYSPFGDWYLSEKGQCTGYIDDSNSYVHISVQCLNGDYVLVFVQNNTYNLACSNPQLKLKKNTTNVTISGCNFKYTWTADEYKTENETQINVINLNPALYPKHLKTDVTFENITLPPPPPPPSGDSSSSFSFFSAIGAAILSTVSSVAAVASFVALKSFSLASSGVKAAESVAVKVGDADADAIKDVGGAVGDLGQGAKNALTGAGDALKGLGDGLGGGWCTGIFQKIFCCFSIAGAAALGCWCWNEKKKSKKSKKNKYQETESEESESEEEDEKPKKKKTKKTKSIEVEKEEEGITIPSAEAEQIHVDSNLTPKMRRGLRMDPENEEIPTLSKKPTTDEIAKYLEEWTAKCKNSPAFVEAGKSTYDFSLFVVNKYGINEPASYPKADIEELRLYARDFIQLTLVDSENIVWENRKPSLNPSIFGILSKIIPVYCPWGSAFSTTASLNLTHDMFCEYGWIKYVANIRDKNKVDFCKLLDIKLTVVDKLSDWELSYLTLEKLIEAKRNPLTPGDLNGCWRAAMDVAFPDKLFFELTSFPPANARSDLYSYYFKRRKLAKVFNRLSEGDWEDYWIISNDGYKTMDFRGVARDIDIIGMSLLEPVIYDMSADQIRFTLKQMRNESSGDDEEDNKKKHSKTTVHELGL